MKSLLFLILFLPSIAFADVSIPRAKQYAYTVFDVSQVGGASIPHPQNLTLPAGSIITNAWLYINMQFAASGTESLGVSCGGSQNILAYTPIKSVAADRMLSGVIATGSFTGAAALLPVAPTVLDLSRGFGSIPVDCSLSFDVRGDAGYTPYTGGKGTLILEFFRL